MNRRYVFVIEIMYGALNCSARSIGPCKIHIQINSKNAQTICSTNLVESDGNKRKRELTPQCNIAISMDQWINE